MAPEKKEPTPEPTFINQRARHFGMSKSISKLIIAGMALSLAVPVGAYAQQKVTQPHTTTKGVTAKAQQMPQGKRYEIAGDALKARTKQSAGARQLAEKGKITRPLNFKLNRPSAPLHVEASEPVNGMVIYADSWQADASGIYSFSTGSTAEIAEIAQVSTMAGNQAGVAAGDRYITSAMESVWGLIFGAYVTVYDVNTWEMVAQYDVIDELDKVALNYAYDASTGSVYGEFYNADLSGYYLGEMDPETMEVTPIAQLGAVYRVMAFAADGTFYVIDSTGALYTMNKTNGETTLVGNTGYASQYISGGAIDQKSGRFYYTTSGDDVSYMLEVNPATAEATVLYVMPDGEEVVGMWVPAPVAEEGAPAQVSNLQATFADGLLNGSVSFTAPTTLFDGTAATGDFTYVLKANGEEIATGTVAAGAEVKYDYTAPASGSYKFTAYCVNEVGEGPKSNVTVYVGIDSPLAPTNVNLVYADNTMTLTWDASQAAHNGYTGEITYTITRYETGKDAVVVAEDITACTYTEEFIPDSDALRNVYYTVEAKTAEGVTAPVASNSVGIGSIIPPYSNSFQTNLNLDGYTIIDANEDGKTFGFYGDMGLRISYNSKADMDDWIITPAVKLEAEKYYSYEVVVANSSNSYSERVEVKAGKVATAEGMTMQVIAPTEVKTGGANITLKGGIAAEETGEYYIGIHGISDADQFYLYIREYSIGEGVSALAPAEVDNAEIVCNPENFFEANISFQVPTTNILGADIETVDWVEVKRDGQLILKVNSPAPGAEVSCVDIVPESGTYTYTMVAHGNYGYGLPVEKTIYVGVPVPAAPAEATIARTETVGQVHVEWTPVTESVDGVAIPAEYITYTVVNRYNEIVAEGLTDTSIDIQAIEEGQTFAFYVIYAKTAGGMSVAKSTAMIPVGTPYELPYNESFVDGSLSYILGTSGAGGASWAVATNETFSDVTDSDDTNGFIYMTGNYLDQYADIFTGLITLNAEKPALKFDYYNLADNDINALEIYVTCDGEQELITSVEQCADDAQIGWNTAYVDLSAYANQTVEVMFRGVVNAYQYILLDAIQIGQLEDYNFKVVSVNGPAAVNPDEWFTLTATVLNAGALTNADYKVELYLNGGKVLEQDGVELATGQKANFEFMQKQNVTAGEQLLYTVKVVCEADADLSDNAADYPVILNIPNYPVATDLKASLTNYGVALTWEEPNLDEDAPMQTVTEDFEEYTAWEQQNIGEWTIVDEDGAEVGGFQGTDLPGIEPGVTTAAFFVFNDTEIGNATFAAHSGHQYMASLFRYDDGTVADWLISPLLSGDAQTVSFYAKSYSSQYPESFQVLYSTTDTDIASFTVVDEYDNIAQDWTCYSFNVPAGAKYFAIKSVASSSFMFMVDDVTYVPANGTALELSIVGYNIYRNGVKINDAPVEETNFVDAEGTTSDKYCVTVVYTIGESAPSILVGVGTTTGVNDMVAGSAVKVEARTIVVTGAEGTVAVYAADGKAIYSEAAAKTNTIAVTPGVYVVKAGEKVTKVIVK